MKNEQNTIYSDIDTEDERVEVNDLKNLIKFLGKTSSSSQEVVAPLKTHISLNTIPKPSCGRSFRAQESPESNTEEDQFFTNNFRKKKLKRRKKRTKCEKFQR